MTYGDDDNDDDYDNDYVTIDMYTLTYTQIHRYTYESQNKQIKSLFIMIAELII